MVVGDLTLAGGVDFVRSYAIIESSAIRHPGCERKVLVEVSLWVPGQSRCPRP